MANKAFTQLPTVASSTVADIICAVQGGVNVQQTLSQIIDLVRDNNVLSYAGNPNTHVSGQTYELCWDTTNDDLYICTTTGSAATAVWTLIATELTSAIATFLTTPSSANLAAAVTDETGSGALVFGTSPTLTTPAITGGTIDNAVIGATTPAAATFTDLTASGDTILGNPGTEGSGIDINGVTYDSVLKVSNINSSNLAQIIYHRHSTTIAPVLLAARSNSDTSAHIAVTNGMSLFTVYSSGWTASHYDLFGAIDFSADSTGTISATSSPGRIRLQVTADGANSPTTALTITNDKIATFAGVVTPSAGISGITDASSAASGIVGEVISSVIAVGSAVSLTTATPVNVTSISLTAGDWDVYGKVIFSVNGATTISKISGAISLTTDTLPTTPEQLDESLTNLEATFTTGTNAALNICPVRINVNSTTSVYLVTQMDFAVNTAAVYGAIWARRVR